MRWPVTEEEAHKKRYGEWAGNSRGNAYDPDRCAAEVYSGRSVISRQCHKAKADGLYCKQHAKMV